MLITLQVVVADATVIAKLNVLTVLGVPPMAPFVGPRVRPPGNVPLVTANEYVPAGVTDSAWL